MTYLFKKTNNPLANPSRQSRSYLSQKRLIIIMGGNAKHIGGEMWSIKSLAVPVGRDFYFINDRV